MNEIDIVNDLMAGLEAGDLEKVSTLISDDFIFNLPLPFPIGKMYVLGFLNAFKTAFSGWSYNFTDVRAEADHVKGNVRPSGTHSNDVSLPGMPPILATGKVITLPQIPVEFVIKDSKLSVLKIDQLPGGTFSSLMENLGINLPGM